jgi:hypothetical protein
MTNQALKLVPGRYRLSFSIDGDGVIEILREAWYGDHFDYDDSIYLTPSEYRFAADFIGQCAGKAEYDFDSMMTDIQELRVEVGPEEIYLKTYLCGGVRTEQLGELSLAPADWADMLPILTAAVDGVTVGGVA